MFNLNDDLEKRYRTPLERIVDEFLTMYHNLITGIGWLFYYAYKILIIPAGIYVLYWLLFHKFFN